MMTRDEAITTFYKKNYKHLVNRMVGRVPNNSHAIAEEVVQDAFVRALEYWRTFDQSREIAPWFNRILAFSLRETIRKENGGPLSLDDEDQFLEPFVLNDDIDIPPDIVRIVQKAISEQPNDKREVLHMFFNLGMKTREIEECTNLNHSNIRQIIRRFRIKWEDENIF
jgi:RNA polymerase sigma factor (sigma-70 family)